MQAKQALKATLTSTQWLTENYLKDLSDQDILVRPVPEANHIAWQMAHLIASEAVLMSILPGAKMPDVPDDIKQCGKGESAKNTALKFRPVADYLEWFRKVRGASIETVANLEDADFSKPNTGPMSAMAPNLGELVVLIANHAMMHAGQFTVVRRALGKPVLF